MNIFKHELKLNFKVFLFWGIALFFLVFAGMMKFTGFGSDDGMNIKELFEEVPRVIMAVFGMSEVDITTLGGYYSVLIYYVLICAAIYGMYLGINTINKEVIDKTSEFILTKPRSRYFILKIKLMAAVIYVIGFAVFAFIFALLAIPALGFQNTILDSMVIYTVIIFITGILFCSIGMFIASITKNTDRGSLYGNLICLAAFIFGVIYDMLEDGGALVVIAPFKFFQTQDVLDGNLDIFTVVMCILVSAGLITISLKVFEKKDV